MSVALDSSGTLDLSTAARSLVSQVGWIPELSEGERLAAQRTWRGRMVNEHISARVFGTLLGQAMAARLSAERCAQLAEFATEELMHARQCASVVLALGGEPRAAWPALPTVPTHAEVPPLEALLRNVLSVCCLAETVAVALIRAETLEIGPPGLRRLLDQILADESGHARWGWSLLEELKPLPEELLAGLDDYLPVALAHLWDHELACLPTHDGLGGVAAQVGVCSGLAARALLRDTVEQGIVPGLQAHGLAADVAWRAVQARA